MATNEARVTANGVDFAYLEAGPSDGPLALCLHGFPDAAPTWRHLLPALAEAGFHAVAPWLRGYAPTSVPADGLYQTGALVRDTVSLHEALGGDERAVIIGHDWGASATYGAAVFAPERWKRVVAIALPPSGAIGSGFFSYDQLRRSWYIFFFQSPLADMAVAMNDLDFIERIWADWSPGYDGATDVASVKDALRDPANLAAAIGYYRALFDPAARLAEPGRGASGSRRHRPSADPVPPRRDRRLPGRRPGRQRRPVPLAGVEGRDDRRRRPLPPRREARHRQPHDCRLGDDLSEDQLAAVSGGDPVVDQRRGDARRARGSSGQPITVASADASRGTGPARNASTNRPRPWRSDPANRD